MADQDHTGEQFGEYRLMRFVGRGGFAEVYQGEHVRLQTRAAIKLLLTRVSAEEEQQFLDEARKVAHLEHAHIVRVLDFSVQNGVPFLVMQYAAGGSLRQLYAKNVPLSIEIILPYVQQVAEALQYAHSQRVIHLDVKPENMLLDVQGNVLLADFGIALALQHTKTHQTLRGFTGTPLYAAPEQLQAKPGLASDQYALATAVYRWLTGDFPFVSDDYFSLGLLKLQNDPPPLRARVPTLSPAVEQVVLRALAKDPAARFPSVRDFAQALTKAAAVPRKTKEQWMDEGFDHGEAERYIEALAAYDQAVRLDPTDVEALNNRGTALERMGHYEEALAVYDLAMKLDPTFATVHYNRGYALRKLKRYEEALAEYDQAVKLDPDDVEAHDQRGKVLEQLGRKAEARQAYQRAEALRLAEEEEEEEDEEEEE
jgi:serine/threonine protein kinase